MEERLQRTALLLGEGAIEKLKGKKVLLFGLGGVGGSCAEALARSGLGHLSIVDADTVEESNINRQLIATYETVGLKKVDAMERRLLSLAPEMEIRKFDMFYLPENAESIDVESYDFVIDAIDTVAAKVSIIDRCAKAGVPVVSAMGCGNRLDPSKLAIGDVFETSYDPLSKVMRGKMRELGIKKLKVVYSKEVPIKASLGEEKGRHAPGSVSFVPPVAGYLLASYAIKELIKE